MSAAVLVGSGLTSCAAPALAAPRLCDASHKAGCFVRRSGTALTVAGTPAKFVGVNVFSAAARTSTDCAGGIPYGNGTDLSTLLDGLPPRSGGYTIRIFITQQTAQVSGVRNWATADHALSVIAARGWRVIVALANEWGDCDNGIVKRAAWWATGYKATQPGDQTSYRRWVQDVAVRYASHPEILAWTLVNEGQAGGLSGDPCNHAQGEADMGAWSDDITTQIRRFDKSHLIAPGYLYDSCGTWQAAWGRLHARSRIDLCDYHDYAPPDQPLGTADPFKAGDAFNLCLADGRAPFAGEVGIRITDVSGAQQRADDLQSKLAAQFAAGSVGEVPWLWGCHDASDPYVFPAGDPALPVIATALP